MLYTRSPVAAAALQQESNVTQALEKRFTLQKDRMLPNPATTIAIFTVGAGTSCPSISFA